MRTARLALAGILLAFGSARAQERLDLSVSGAGVFSKQVSSSTSAITLAPRDGFGVFGTVRYHFNHLSAVESNFGHMTNSQIFERTPDEFKIRTSISEYSAAFVLTPYQGKKLRPFLLAGLGGLRWNPDTQYINGNVSSFGASRQTTLAFLYGGGVDYQAWWRVWLRAQYRGLAFRAPDFELSDFHISANGHMAEPSVGIVVKF
jgi:opacity protein-like surface antigen